MTPRGGCGSLSGTVALVTGGDSVLGLSCARRLEKDGAVVTICGTAERRLKESADAYGLCYAVADATEEEQVDDIFAAAAASGPLRIVIAAAQVPPRSVRFPVSTPSAGGPRWTSMPPGPC